MLRNMTSHVWEKVKVLVKFRAVLENVYFEKCVLCFHSICRKSISNSLGKDLGFNLLQEMLLHIIVKLYTQTNFLYTTTMKSGLQYAHWFRMPSNWVPFLQQDLTRRRPRFAWSRALAPAAGYQKYIWLDWGERSAPPSCSRLSHLVVEPSMIATQLMGWRRALWATIQSIISLDSYTPMWIRFNGSVLIYLGFI